MAKSENKEHRYAALLFALQIPSICSRVEFPKTNENTGDNQNDPNVLYSARDGRPFDKNLYKKWIASHEQEFKQLFGLIISIDDWGNDIYALRNSLTHSGYINETKYFIFADIGTSSMITQSALFISIESFCRNIFAIATSFLHSINYIMPSNNFEIDNDSYRELQNEIYDFYEHFWKNYGEDKRILYAQYFELFVGNDITKYEEIKQKHNISHETFQKMQSIASDVEYLREEEIEILKKYGIS